MGEEPVWKKRCDCCGPAESLTEGNRLMMSETWAGARCSICSAPTTVVGEGAVYPLALRREPVTTMSSSAGGLDAAGGAGSWAWAVAASASDGAHLKDVISRNNTRFLPEKQRLEGKSIM